MPGERQDKLILGVSLEPLPHFSAATLEDSVVGIWSAVSCARKPATAVNALRYTQKF